jgi:hypothetical protein
VGGNSPIAQTLDRDFGFVTRYSVNPRAARHAAMNLKPQSLGGCLAMDWNDNVDEIGHADLTISDVVRTPARHRIGSGRRWLRCDHARGSYIGDTRIKNPCESD